MKILRTLQAILVMIIFVSFQSTAFASTQDIVTEKSFDYVDTVHQVQAGVSANTIKLYSAFIFAGVRLEPERLASVKNNITGFSNKSFLVKIFTSHKFRHKDRPAWTA